MISDKVHPHHLQRMALLYVQQSSAHQVLHNRESSALQYTMRDRLAALGWSEIEVIDDDLGRSAAGGVQRAGFERMVAQVCLGKVGAVAAREVSRFARNSRDLQQLIEMCRAVDTVLIDQETIYAPCHGNDRLNCRRRCATGAGFYGAAQSSFRFHHISTDEVYGTLGPDGLFSKTTAYAPN